ncbi:hypothetical protein, partial [Shinella sp. DD12]|uniref:hypothetical protein n=1 Tax=Shinella sp. DD12 TaxID=1410620 RepID=UPI0018CC5F69
MTTTNRPTYGVYQVEEGKNDRKGFWTKVGAAWPHEKGDGFSIKLTCLPLDGRLVGVRTRAARNRTLRPNGAG